jgi:hypothetical protein
MVFGSGSCVDCEKARTDAGYLRRDESPEKMNAPQRAALRTPLQEAKAHLTVALQ